MYSGHKGVTRVSHSSHKVQLLILLIYFIATPPYRGWRRGEGLLLLHSFLSLDISVAFSILRFGASEKSAFWVGLTQFDRTWRTRRCSGMRLILLTYNKPLVKVKQWFSEEVETFFSDCFVQQ